MVSDPDRNRAPRVLLHRDHDRYSINLKTLGPELNELKGEGEAVIAA
jgi:hypothetical protein